MIAQLNFEVTNQIIKRVDKFEPVEKSLNYLLASFVFKTGEWNNAPLKTAIFTTEEDKAYKAIINDGLCTVPCEVLQKPGYVNVSVYGGDRITTNNASVYIEASGYVEDAENENDPTSDIYDQMMGEVNYIKDGNLDGGLFTDWNTEVGG